MKLKFSWLLLLCVGTYAYGQKNCLNFHVIDSAPLGFVDSNGDKRGVHVELLKNIEQISGICIRLELMPYARILYSLEEGQHDGGILFKYPQNASFIEFVAHVQDMQTIIVANRRFKLSSLASLDGLIIGKTRGTDLSDDISLAGKFNVVELTHYEQAAALLSKDRIDAIAGSALVLYYQLSNVHIGQEPIDFANKLVLGTRAQWLQISRKTSTSIDVVKLKKATETAVADPSYKALMQQYYGVDWQKVNQ
jgi:ABC-type amino acid transport substrate-binding protein